MLRDCIIEWVYQAQLIPLSIQDDFIFGIAKQLADTFRESKGHEKDCSSPEYCTKQWGTHVFSHGGPFWSVKQVFALVIGSLPSLLIECHRHSET